MYFCPITTHTETLPTHKEPSPTHKETIPTHNDTIPNHKEPHKKPTCPPVQNELSQSQLHLPSIHRLPSLSVLQVSYASICNIIIVQNQNNNIITNQYRDVCVITDDSFNKLTRKAAVLKADPENKENYSE